jgi:hypothetical protein
MKSETYLDSTHSETERTAGEIPKVYMSDDKLVSYALEPFLNREQTAFSSSTLTDTAVLLREWSHLVRNMAIDNGEDQIEKNACPLTCSPKDVLTKIFEKLSERAKLSNDLGINPMIDEIVVPKFGKPNTLIEALNSYHEETREKLKVLDEYLDI